MAPPVAKNTVLVFKLSVIDEKRGYDSSMTAVKLVNSEQKWSSFSKVLELPPSSAGDQVREGNVTNSTGQ